MTEEEVVIIRAFLSGDDAAPAIIAGISSSAKK
jgi:hypothetical protein